MKQVEYYADVSFHPREESEKKPYLAPTLYKFGDIVELTRGAGGPERDSNGAFSAGEG